MRVSLTLAFDRHGLSGPFLAHERLSLNYQGYDLFDPIEADCTPVKEGVYWYMDEGLQLRHTDPYGDMITSIPAYLLVRHLSGLTLCKWDKAVRKFIGALPSGTWVVLWWH